MITRQCAFAWRILAQTLTFLMLAAGLFLSPVFSQSGASPSNKASHGNILLLYSYGHGGKGISVFDDGLISTLSAGGVGTNSLFFEFLDLERNHTDPQYRTRIQDLLRKKYAERHIDLIVTVQQPALNWLLNEGQEIAADAPIISLQAPLPTAAEVKSRHVLSLLTSFDIKGTLAHALALFPDTKRVFFVSGSSDADKKMAAQAARIAEPLKGALEFEYSADLSMDSMLKRTATLPPHSLIIFTQYNRDSSGLVTVAYEVESMIVKAANAPVFGLYDFNLINGGIGGSVIGVKALGEKAAATALDLLGARLQLTQPLSSATLSPIPIFNWEEIKRWGGNVSGLPANTVFVNRAPTFWEQYRLYVIGLGIFVVAQSLLIAALLISRRKRRLVELSLQESEENLAITLHSIGDAVIATDPQGRVTRMNQTAQRLSGWTLAEALQRPLSEVFRIVNATTHQAIDDPVHLVIKLGQVVGIANHTVLLARDGKQYQIADSAAPIRNATGAIVGVVLVFSDVTERYRIEEELRRADDRIRNTFKLIQIPLSLETSQGVLIDCNDALCEATGFTREETLGRTALELGLWADPDHRGAMVALLRRDGQVKDFEFQLRRRDGQLRTMEFSTRFLTPEPESVLLSVARDITKRKAAEEQIHTLAFYDPLTQLPNRRLLLDRLQQSIASSTRSGWACALLLVDLDNFKDVNDTLGHEQGDVVLRQVAMRLRACAHDGDTVARLGSDDFVVLLEQPDQSPLEAAMLAEAAANRILDSLKQPYALEGAEISCTASIGITLVGTQTEDKAEPLKRAELAMFQAKAHGRNTLSFFDPQMQAVVNARVATEAGLREAIEKKQFLLHYQPQVTGDGHVTGVEALLRWLDPKRGMVAPAEFIPMAEETGLILPIGNWIIETACKQLKRWAGQPAMAHLTIAVNVSARQFLERDFVDQVLATLARTGATPNRLKLELTEGVMIANVEEVIIKMNALKGCGIGFSLDDFGTGYSSLSYLKRLPLEQLKIDQGFVRDILIDANDAAIARMVIVLAGSLGLSVMAEGIETQAQRDFLADLGCSDFQGYLYSRPVPINELEAQLGSGKFTAPV